MFRIRLPNGVEMMFPSVEDFQAAVQSGVVTSDSEIFHQKAERWVPIASHPTYHRAVSAARAATAAAQGAAPQPAPVRRVLPGAAAPAAAVARPAVAPAPSEVAPPQTGPRPAVAPPLNVSAQRPRLALEGTMPAAPAVPPVSASAQRPALILHQPSAPPQPKPALRVSPPPAPTRPPAPTPPPPPAAVPAPARHSQELKFVDVGPVQPPADRPVAPIKASAPRPAIKSPPPALVEDDSTPSIELPDLTDDFEIVEGFMPQDSAATMELSIHGPAHHPDPVKHRDVAATSAPAHSHRPAPAPAEAPVSHASVPAPAHVPLHEHVHAHAHAQPHASAPAKSGSGRWLIAAGLGAALIGGGALVAWRSGSAKQVVAQDAPNAATSAYTPVQRPELQTGGGQPTGTVPAPTTSPAAPTNSKPAAQVTAPPAATVPAATAAARPQAPAVDTSNQILPGRPQSMAVDLDVSGAAVGTSVGAAGPAGGNSGQSLGIVADHYADAAAEAGKQLEARLTQIGYSRLLAPLRFGSVEGMEGARHTVSSAVGMVAAYRARMQALERIYGDSAARAQQGQKASPKEMLAWDHRLPQRESAEAAQAVDLALSKVDQLYAALLAHPEQVKSDASSVTISDPELAKQYQALRQWLAQRFDTWSGAPADVVPPTVRQTMRAFSDAISR